MLGAAPRAQPGCSPSAGQPGACHPPCAPSPNGPAHMPHSLPGAFSSSSHAPVSSQQHHKICLAIHSLVPVAQSCPTLCNPMDCSPPGSYVCEIFQARILEWVAISFSRGEGTQGSRPRDRTQGLNLPDPGIEPRSPALQADSLPTELRGKPERNSIHVSKRKSCH